MWRRELFRRGFVAGWRDVTPQQRARASYTGVLIGAGAALLAIVFIL